MKALFLLFFICCGFFISGCSGVSNEDDPPERDGFEDDGEEEARDRSQHRRVESEIPCEGDDYTLYLDDCQRGEEGDSFPSATLSSRQEYDDYEKKYSPTDILFVLNTSNTMYWYIHHGFKKKFSNFISHLSGVDWRMLFTTASYSHCFFCAPGPDRGEAMNLDIYSAWHKPDGKKYMDKDFPYARKTFLHTITADPDRSFLKESVDSHHASKYPPYYGGGEYPLRALKGGFSANKPLLREEANLVAIIVSHEDEKAKWSHASKGDSRIPTKTQQPHVTAESLKEEFQTVHGEAKELYILNIIILPGDQACLLENQKKESFFTKESSEGKRLAEVAQKIGGGNFSICLDDYSPVARAIKRISVQ